MKATGVRLQAAGLLGVLLLGGGAACGKRGNPLPPLRPLPARVADAAARRVAGRVELRLTIPATNLDNSTPPSVTRVDIYGAVGPAVSGLPPSIPAAALSAPMATSKAMTVTRFPAARWPVPAPIAPGDKRALPPPTTAVLLMRPEFLRGHIDVKPPPPPAPSTKTAKPAAPAAAAPVPPADDRPAAGEIAVFADDVTKEHELATSDDRSVLRYVLVPVAGRNRFGTPSAVLEVPLRPAPAPPAALVLSYDERALKLVWTGAPGGTFRVYRSDAAGKEQAPSLTSAPLAAAEFTTAVEFGVERCFIVRSAVTAGAVSVESEASPPVCRTAVDTFPPPAPTQLFEQPYEGRISLGWAAVDAPDLAGYVVLRADGDNATMRPLMTSPAIETSFVDATTKAGTRYTYAVVAVDKAGNRSPESNRVIEVGR